MSKPKNPWKRVVFSAECDEFGFCPVCKDIDFADCGCPGPTQDGYEYMKLSGVLYARKTARFPKEVARGPVRSRRL